MLKPNSQTTTILMQAREKIADPERWTKGALWRAKEEDDQVKTGFCMLGAVVDTNEPRYLGGYRRKDDPLKRWFPEIRVLAQAVEELHLLEHTDDPSDLLHIKITGSNDCPERTHDEVMEIMDRAIAISIQEDGQQDHAP